MAAIVLLGAVGLVGACGRFGPPRREPVVPAAVEEVVAPAEATNAAAPDETAESSD